ncbi:MAG: U32 family peptidase [Candidatus Omnitrophica bacterium]|nr:U32 family peptidase [Candidatus Omnitrophota bacterium]
MKHKKPELISPAGDWCALNTAIEAGADSVYFGIKNLNMRHWAANFDMLEIKKVMSRLHDNGKKGYLALNTIMYNSDMKKIKKILENAKKANVDAVMLWDMAALQYAKDLKLKTHLSTQASVANFTALKFYHSQGVKRIVLARECNLSDIKEIIKNVKKEKLDCEIETFIHGALCVSISGRCFLSHASFSKSANRGMCLQPCRRAFLIKDTRDKENDYVLGTDYVLSTKDLCTIEFIDKLIESGISAFKIEGRMRSAEYVGEVTAVYREAIDSFFAGKLDPKSKKALKIRLSLTYNRGFTDGFFFSQPNDTGSKKGQSAYNKLFVGKVINFYNKVNVAGVSVIDNGIKKGQNVLICGKTTPARVAKIDEMHKDEIPVDSAKKGDRVGIKLPFKARRNDKVFLYELK